MNIVREELNEETALLRVQIAPQDYQEELNKAIDKYRKNMRMPGFRQGKIPVSLIKKQYGKSLLADELNKIIGKSLTDYVKDNNLELLGQPIPSVKEENKGDFDQPADFEFPYEIATVPSFTINMDGKTALDYHLVAVDDKLINQQIDDLRRRYGKLVSSDEVAEKDLVLATLTELNDDESIKENGVSNSTTVSMEFLENDDVKKSFLGKKIGDTLTVNPKDISKGENDMISMLGVEKSRLAELSDKFSLKITEIKQMEMAEINQELLDKLYGKDAVKSEDEWKERIKNDLTNMFSNDSDRLLMNDAYEHLMDKTTMNLPSDFLKRWIQISAENPISMEEIEHHYSDYEKGMKWQLIQGKIFKDNNLQLKDDEVINFTKGLLASQFAQYGLPVADDKILTEQAQRVLSDKNESARIYDMIAEKKLIEYVKSTAKIKENKISYDDFVALAQKSNHIHEHEHDHDHDHHEH